MNPITALMLSHAIEDDRRREMARRPHRFVEPESTHRTDEHRRRWLLRIPLLRLAASKP